MRDPDPGVQIETAKSLALAGSPRATPVLIAGLDSPNGKVRNASKAALNRIWGESESRQDAEQWQAFWATKAAGVPDPIAAAGLKPLYVPEPEYDGAEMYHAE